MCADWMVRIRSCRVPALVHHTWFPGKAPDICLRQNRCDGDVAGVRRHPARQAGSKVFSSGSQLPGDSERHGEAHLCVRSPR